MKKKPGAAMIVAMLELFVALIGVAAGVVGAAAQGAAGTTTGKPVIGKPLTGSARPIPGKRFTVSFKVTDSFTKAPVSRGTLPPSPERLWRTSNPSERASLGCRLSFPRAPRAR